MGETLSLSILQSADRQGQQSVSCHYIKSNPAQTISLVVISGFDSPVGDHRELTWTHYRLLLRM